MAVPGDGSSIRLFNKNMIRHYTYKVITRYIPSTFCTKKRVPDSGNPHVFWSH